MYKFEVKNPAGIVTYSNNNKSIVYEKLSTAYVMKDIYNDVVKRIKVTNKYNGFMLFTVSFFNGYTWSITTERI